MDKIEIGDKVEDKINGFVGIVEAATVWKHNADTCVVAPMELKEGKPVENEQIDVCRLKILQKKLITFETCKACPIKIDDDVKDIQSPFKGCVIAVTSWLTGCTRLGITAPKVRKGIPAETVWLPESQVELINPIKVETKPLQSKKTPGPMSKAC